MVRGSAKDLHYFWVVSPLESPKIMGLKVIHSPEALKHQASLLFCPWCGKEGQNEGTMVNHLCTGHYHLRLVCKRCLSYFTTTLDIMQHHTQGCESTCISMKASQMKKWKNLCDPPTAMPSHEGDAMAPHKKRK